MVRDLIGLQVGAGAVERGLHHQRQWDLRGQALAAGLGIAADLERAAVRGELRPKGADMAHRARLPGLAREVRHGLRRRAQQQDEQRGKQRLKRQSQCWLGHRILPYWEGIRSAA